MATPPKKPYILSENQKSLILDNFGKGVTDVNLLTKLVTGNDKKDGRDIEGKAVRMFLAENGKRYKTKHNPVREDSPELSEENKKQIELWMAEDKTTIWMAQQVFGAETKKLSREWRAVFAYVQEVNPDYRPDQAPLTSTKFYAPKELSRVVNYINQSVGINLDHEKISGKYKAYVEKLKCNMGSMRFARICDSYLNQKDRDLFIEEFVKLTWDKPDLTADELNLYMSVCKDIVNGEILSAHIITLNSVFDEMGEDPTEFSVKFSEMLNSKTNEFQQNQKRVADTIKKLQGDRADRLKNLAKDETSFISLVQMAQEEEERRNMLRLAELQRAAITEEANRLESLDEFMCRIMGVSKEEIV
jgi:hypothetical protein